MYRNIIHVLALPCIIVWLLYQNDCLLLGKKLKEMRVDELPDLYKDISIKGDELAVTGWYTKSFLLFIHGNTYTLIIFLNYFCKPGAADHICDLMKKWDQFSDLRVKIIFFRIL